MKKLGFEKFSRFITALELNSKIKGGNVFLEIASYPKTAGGSYWFGMGNSTHDFKKPSGGCVYVFSDGRILEGNCE